MHAKVMLLDFENEIAHLQVTRTVEKKRQKVRVKVRSTELSDTWLF